MRKTTKEEQMDNYEYAIASLLHNTYTGRAHWYSDLVNGMTRLGIDINIKRRHLTININFVDHVQGSNTKNSI